MNPPRLKAVPLLAAFCLLIAPAAAGAAQVIAPPGNSGAQEYLETVPDGTSGGHPGIDVHNGSVTALRSRGALSPQLVSRLSAAGPNGQAAAKVAEAGAVPAAQGAKGAKASGGGGGSADTSLAATHASDGLGVLLPVLLVLMLLAATVFGLLRRRRTES